MILQEYKDLLVDYSKVNTLYQDNHNLHKKLLFLQVTHLYPIQLYIPTKILSLMTTQT